MDAMAPKGKCHFLLTENTVRNITSFLQDRWNQYLQPLHSVNWIALEQQTFCNLILISNCRNLHYSLDNVQV